MTLKFYNNTYILREHWALSVGLLAVHRQSWHSTHRSCCLVASDKSCLMYGLLNSSLLNLLLHPHAQPKLTINHSHFFLTWLQATMPPQPTIATSARAWRLHCACMGGFELPVAGFINLCEPIMQLVMHASRFWCFWRIKGEVNLAKISADAESFGSQQMRHRNCPIDGQCKPPSSDRPDT